MTKRPPQPDPTAQILRRGGRCTLPRAAREKPLRPRGGRVLAEREQRDAARLLKLKLKLLLAALLHDDIADDRALRIAVFELADVRLPRPVGRGELVGGLAAGERRGQREAGEEEPCFHLYAAGSSCGVGADVCASRRGQSAT